MSAPQIVCPVCHTPQANAWDCVVCGGSLHDKPRHWAVPVEALSDFESTPFADPGSLPVEPLAGLEQTAFVGWEAASPLPIEGLETTAYEISGEISLDVVPGLETTAFEPDGLPTPMLPVICRYCGTSWREGSVFCGGCGVRVGSSQRAGAERASGERTESLACKACGAPGQASGSRCARCGHQVVE